MTLPRLTNKPHHFFLWTIQVAIVATLALVAHVAFSNPKGAKPKEKVAAKKTEEVKSNTEADYLKLFEAQKTLPKPPAKVDEILLNPDIDLLVTEQLPAFKEICVKQLAGDDKEFSGLARVELILEKSGEVASISVKKLKSSTDAKDFAPCVTAFFKWLKYPAFEGPETLNFEQRIMLSRD